MFCWLSGGSNFIVRSHPPGVGVNSIFFPVLGSKLKPCLCGPKQTHRPQSVISVTAIKGRRQLTFLLSMAIGFPVPSSVHRILFLGHTLCLCLQLCTRSFARSGINTKCDSSLWRIQSVMLKRFSVCDKT